MLSTVTDASFGVFVSSLCSNSESNKDLEVYQDYDSARFWLLDVDRTHPLQDLVGNESLILVTGIESSNERANEVCHKVYLNAQRVLR
jgi:hypothetical protein